MSFWDNVKKLTQPYADDDYDDYEEDEDDSADQYEEPEERPARRTARRRSAPTPAPSAAPADEQEEDDFGFSAPSISVTPGSSASAGGFSGSILGGSGSASASVSVSNKQAVVLFRPNNFNDTSKAADDLRDRKAVIVNMENVDKAMARRVVDFLSGCVYALDGDVKKIAQSAYIFCPHNMDIEGDLEAIQAEIESYV